MLQMKENLLLSAICCILFLNGAHSQSELSLPEEGIVVYEHNLNAFLVINDSTSYHTYVSGKWTEHPYQFISDAFSFEKFKNEFVPISVKGRGMYFVHKGCGMTYTLKNDTLQRIDKSFAHKSQYHRTVFSVSNNL